MMRKEQSLKDYYNSLSGNSKLSARLDDNDDDDDNFVRKHWDISFHSGGVQF